jgi:hypothetical protein
MKSGTEERNQLTKKLLEGNGVEAPLLATKAIDRGEEEEEETLSVGRKILEENKKLWIVAGPSIFTRFSTFGVTVISQAFIGHIGSTELAAYAIVSTVFMRFANGILVRAFLPPSLRVRIQLISVASVSHCGIGIVQALFFISFCLEMRSVRFHLITRSVENISDEWVQFAFCNELAPAPV